MNLTVEQVKAYHEYMNHIKTTMDITWETLRDASHDRLKEAIIKNGIIWNEIRNTIEHADLPKEYTRELTEECDDRYNEYRTKMKNYIISKD
jgi:hypothetical protein